jgi:hypothetical protein
MRGREEGRAQRLIEGAHRVRAALGHWIAGGALEPRVLGLDPLEQLASIRTLPPLADCAVARDALLLVAAAPIRSEILVEAGAPAGGSDGAAPAYSTLVRSLALPTDRAARVRFLPLLTQGAPIRGVELPPLAARTVQYPVELGAVRVVDTEPRRFALSPAVASDVASFRRLPSRRTALPLESLSGAERASFLAEAAALKSVPAGEAELLAVFRSIPVELIDRICYLPDENAIEYTIEHDVRVERTRLHDLAVVRQTAGGESAFVPHRTRYLMAFLS